VDDGDGLFDVRAADKLEEFIEAARNQGLDVILSSTYRSYEDQSYLYDLKVDEYGEEEAQTIVAIPGTSEHQTGLAADIMDEVYPYLNEWQEHTEAQAWLMEHAPEYGFILRYPPDASDITGIIYEPWHYRYVGEKFAKEITKRGLTLEEYVAWRRGR
jgi:D-alanyl-D-alanine carboxypeptidase